MLDDPMFLEKKKRTKGPKDSINTRVLVAENEDNPFECKECEKPIKYSLQCKDCNSLFCVSCYKEHSNPLNSRCPNKHSIPEDIESASNQSPVKLQSPIRKFGDNGGILQEKSPVSPMLSDLMSEEEVRQPNLTFGTKSPKLSSVRGNMKRETETVRDMSTTSHIVKSKKKGKQLRRDKSKHRRVQAVAGEIISPAMAPSLVHPPTQIALNLENTDETPTMKEIGGKRGTKGTKGSRKKLPTIPTRIAEILEAARPSSPLKKKRKSRKNSPLKKGRKSPGRHDESSPERSKSPNTPDMSSDPSVIGINMSPLLSYPQTGRFTPIDISTDQVSNMNNSQFSTITPIHVRSIEGYTEAVDNINDDATDGMSGRDSGSVSGGSPGFMESDILGEVGGSRAESERHSSDEANPMVFQRRKPLPVEVEVSTAPLNLPNPVSDNNLMDTRALTEELKEVYEDNGEIISRDKLPIIDSPDFMYRKSVMHEIGWLESPEGPMKSEEGNIDIGDNMNTGIDKDKDSMNTDPPKTPKAPETPPKRPMHLRPLRIKPESIFHTECELCGESIKSNSNIKGHREICSKLSVKCRYEGCEMWTERRVIKEHEGGCEYRMVICDQCGEGVQVRALPLHEIECINNRTTFVNMGMHTETDIAFIDRKGEKKDISKEIHNHQDKIPCQAWKCKFQAQNILEIQAHWKKSNIYIYIYIDHDNWNRKVIAYLSIGLIFFILLVLIIFGLYMKELSQPSGFGIKNISTISEDNSTGIDYSLWIKDLQLRNYNQKNKIIFNDERSTKGNESESENQTIINLNNEIQNITEENTNLTVKNNILASSNQDLTNALKAVKNQLENDRRAMIYEKLFNFDFENKYGLLQNSNKVLKKEIEDLYYTDIMHKKNILEISTLIDPSERIAYRQNELEAKNNQLKNEKNENSILYKKLLEIIVGIKQGIVEYIRNIRKLKEENRGLRENIEESTSDNELLKQELSEIKIQLREIKDTAEETAYKYTNLKYNDITNPGYLDKIRRLEENLEHIKRTNTILKTKLNSNEDEHNIFRENEAKSTEKLKIENKLLKEQLELNREGLQALRGIHIEYKNTPDEHYRKQIENLLEERKTLVYKNLKERENFNTEITKLKGELSLWNDRQQANKPYHIRYINTPDEYLLHQLMDQNHILEQNLKKLNLQLSDVKLDNHNLKALLLLGKTNKLNNNNDNRNTENNNFGIKKELVIKDSELKLLKQIYSEEKGRLILDIRNLKEEMEFNIEKFQGIKTTHIEYQNTPDEFLRMEIGDLHEQKNILEISNNKLRSEIDILKEDKFNIKSHILQEKRDMNREWPIDHFSLIYIKRRLESLHQEYRILALNMNIKTTELRNSNNNLKQEILTNNGKLQALKTVHIEYKNTPDEFSRKEIIDLRDINTILKNNIKELNAELTEIKIDKFNLKSEILERRKYTNMRWRSYDNSNGLFLKNKLVHIHQEYNSFTKISNAKVSELLFSNKNLKLALLSKNQRFHALKLVHIEYKNTPDEFLRMKIIDLTGEKYILQNSIKMLRKENTQIKSDKINLKYSITSDKAKINRIINKEDIQYDMRRNLLMKKEIESFFVIKYSSMKHIFEEQISELNILNFMLKEYILSKNTIIKIVLDANQEIRTNLYSDKNYLKNELVLKENKFHTMNLEHFNYKERSKKYLKTNIIQLKQANSILMKKIIDLSLELMLGRINSKYKLNNFQTLMRANNYKLQILTINYRAKTKYLRNKLIDQGKLSASRTVLINSLKHNYKNSIYNVKAQLRDYVPRTSLMLNVNYIMKTRIDNLLSDKYNLKAKLSILEGSIEHTQRLSNKISLNYRQLINSAKTKFILMGQGNLLLHGNLNSFIEKLKIQGNNLKRNFLLSQKYLAYVSNKYNKNNDRLIKHTIIDMNSKFTSNNIRKDLQITNLRIDKVNMKKETNRFKSEKKRTYYIRLNMETSEIVKNKNLKYELELRNRQIQTQNTKLSSTIYLPTYKYKHLISDIIKEKSIEHAIYTQNTLSNRRIILNIKSHLESMNEENSLHINNQNGIKEYQKVMIDNMKMKMQQSEREEKYYREQIRVQNEEIDILDNILISEEYKNQELENKQRMLERDYKRLRGEEEKAVRIYGSTGILNDLKIHSIRRYVPYVFEFIVIQGTHWTKSNKQLDRKDWTGNLYKDVITSSDLPTVQLPNPHKRGEIVNGKYYIAPSSINGKIIITDTENLESVEKELIIGESDEIVSCSSLYDGRAICCMENGRTYAYDFEDETFDLYYTFADTIITTCKGMRDGALAIGDGSKIVIYTASGELLSSGSAEGNVVQNQMAEIKDGVVILTESSYLLCYNYFTSETNPQHYPFGDWNTRYYNAITPVQYREGGFVVSLVDSKYSSTIIELWHMDSQGELAWERAQTILDGSNCTQYTTITEIDPGYAVAIGGYNNADSSSCKLCFWDYNYPENDYFCWDKTYPNEKINDIIVSLFGY